MFECVLNLSTGRRDDVEALSAAAGSSLRDVHRDEAHNRSVYTLIAAPDELASDVRRLIATAMGRLDLRTHVGVHPRLGVVDVVPFVALADESTVRAVSLRDETARWIADTFDVPVFLYGPLPDGTTRSLPEIRRRAFTTLAPDFGPPSPHPVRGASAVGQRDLLVAWNLWVRGITLEEGRRVAQGLRRDEVRALAFALPDFVQISCNLIAPLLVGPSQIYDEVAARVPPGSIDHAELVGLAPAAVLERETPDRWAQLDLDPGRTIEARARP